MNRSHVDIDPSLNAIPVKRSYNLSGGGGRASIFSLGALRRFHEYGLLLGKNNEKISFSALSGSTITLQLLELAICHRNTDTSINTDIKWYDNYVRSPIYKIFRKTLPIKLIVQLMNPFKLYYFTDSVINFGRSVIKHMDYLPYVKNKCHAQNSNYLFYYNYVDLNHTHISSDFNKIKSKYGQPDWQIMRMLMCIFPISFISNTYTTDCSFVDNYGITTTLSKVEPSEMINIAVFDDYYFDQYKHKPLTFWNIITDYFWNIQATTLHTIHHLSQMIINLKKHNNGLKHGNISMTEKSLNEIPYYSDAPSDLYCTKGVFKFVPQHEMQSGEYDINNTMFNGLLYYNEDVMKIMENDGYCHAESYIRQHHPELDPVPFILPNPEYNNNHKNKKIMRKFHETSALRKTLGSIIGQIYSNIIRH